MPAKIAVLDIERQSGLVDGIWDLRQRGWLSPSQVVERPRVICFAWKWLGDNEVHFSSEWDDGHREMIERARGVLDECDYLIGWNSKSFDVKHLRAEMAEYGMMPPSPHRDIDLMREAKRHFAFLSNRMSYVAELLDCDGKLDTGGASLWRALRFGEGEKLADARRLMREYNERDVELTEELWLALRPWCGGVNLPLFDDCDDDDDFVPRCSNCGSTSIHYRGTASTLTRLYRRFCCQDCGRWGRELRSTGAAVSAGL